MKKELSAEKYIDLLDAGNHTCWAISANIARIEYWDSVKIDYLCKKC